MMGNPTTKVANFNGALDGFTGVDPIRYSSGLWLEEATTNLVTNPSAEVNATGWGAYGGTTVTRETDDFYIGVAGIKCVHNGGNTVGVAVNTKTSLGGTGKTLAYSAYVKDASARNLRFQARIFYGDASNEFKSAVNFVGSASYARLITVATADAVKTLNFAQPHVSVNGAQSASNFRVDAAQVEEKGYATSYADASMGSGYTLNGDGTSTRAASSASISPSGHIDPATGSLALRLTRVIDTGAEELYFECGTVGSGTDALRGGVDASDHPFVEWNSNNAGWERLTSTATVTVDTEFVYLTDWTGTVTRLQIDDAAIESGTRDATEGDWGAGDLVLEAA